jgi:hypothetical protein
VPLFVQGPIALQRTPQPLLPSAIASCRGPGMPVPRARHGHAAALGGQDPRACGPAPRCQAEPQPRQAVPRPRHDLAVRGNHTTRPRRRVHVVDKPLGHSLKHARRTPHTSTRSFPLGNSLSVIPPRSFPRTCTTQATRWHSVIPSRSFPRTHMTHATHWHSVIPSNAHAQHLHTRTHTTACHTGSGSHTRSGVRPTSGPRLSGEARRAAPWARLVREREGQSGGLWAGLLS